MSNKTGIHAQMEASNTTYYKEFKIEDLESMLDDLAAQKKNFRQPIMYMGPDMAEEMEAQMSGDEERIARVQAKMAEKARKREESRLAAWEKKLNHLEFFYLKKIEEEFGIKFRHNTYTAVFSRYLSVDDHSDYFSTSIYRGPQDSLWTYSERVQDFAGYSVVESEYNREYRGELQDIYELMVRTKHIWDAKGH